MWAKVKWIGIGVATLVIGALLAVALLFGNGGFEVVAPKDASVTVNVDGSDVGTIVQGAHARFPLEQGAHTVKLSTSKGKTSTHRVDVKNGAFDQVLPVGEQCFVVLDVTNYWYEKKKLLDKLTSAANSGIEVKSKLSAPVPFDTPAGVFFSSNELPDSIEQGKRTELLLEIPCKAAQGSDADVVAAADL